MNPEETSEDGRFRRSEASTEEVLAASRRHTRRAFAGMALAAGAGYGLYRWIETTPGTGMQPEALRAAFQTNARLSRDLFRERALAPTYPVQRAETLRVNGVFGLKQALALDHYRLQVVGVRDAEAHPRYAPDVTAWRYRFEGESGTADRGREDRMPPDEANLASRAPETAPAQRDRAKRGREEAGHSSSTIADGTPGLLLTMADVTQLPRHELVSQFKCIEGWSQIVHWAGVRMADFLEAYPPAPVNGREPRYVYMETPDGDYYVGYDMEVCRHPQTLLVTEMMGAPLTQLHGAPLRVHMPTKYGYKQIKRIGLIRYMDERPDDYWTKLGYDWYAGL